MFITVTPDEIAALLSSNDWKERLRGEYYELRIRYEKLKAYNVKTEIRYRMTPSCVEKAEDEVARRLMRDQQDAMGHYLYLLELRAASAGIDLQIFA